jgi:hypothetical protein
MPARYEAVAGQESSVQQVERPLLVADREPPGNRSAEHPGWEEVPLDRSRGENGPRGRRREPAQVRGRRKGTCGRAWYPDEEDHQEDRDRDRNRPIHGAPPREAAGVARPVSTFCRRNSGRIARPCYERGPSLGGVSLRESGAFEPGGGRHEGPPDRPAGRAPLSREGSLRVVSRGAEISCEAVRGRGSRQSPRPGASPSPRSPRPEARGGWTLAAHGPPARLLRRTAFSGGACSDLGPGCWARVDP